MCSRRTEVTSTLRFSVAKGDSSMFGLRKHLLAQPLRTIAHKVHRSYGDGFATEDGWRDQVDITHWLALMASSRESSGFASLREKAQHLSTPFLAHVGELPPFSHVRDWLRSANWQSFAVRTGVGSVLAIAGMALITWLATTAYTIVYPEAVALLYCLLVLCIAMQFGHVAAGVAVVLSLFVYQWLYPASVNRTLKGIEVGVILIVAWIIVWFHFRRAYDTEHHLSGLIALARLVVSTPDETTLLEQLLGRLLELAYEYDVSGLAIIAPNDDGKLTTLATSPRNMTKEPALLLEAGAQIAEANAAFKYKRVTVYQGAKRRGNLRRGRSTFYVPLQRQSETIGLVALHGKPRTSALASALFHGERDIAQITLPGDVGDQKPVMLHVYASYLAVALDRLRWRQQAITMEALKSSDHLKNTLLGSVAHDLNTPVTAIRLAVDTLLKDHQTSPLDIQRDQLDFLRTEVARLARVINNSLSLVRLEEGVAIPHLEWHLMSDIVGEVLGRLEAAHKTADHSITIDVPDDLPLISIDCDQIEAVLTNLLENAIIYSPPSTCIVVRARVIENPRRLMVQVIDQGPGIPTAAQQSIFDKYYRVRTQGAPAPPAGGHAGQRHKGTGLGLAICASIVRLHAGNIGVESKVGQGACFWFTLPMKSEPPLRALPEE